jgi:hypothetical protein
LAVLFSAIFIFVACCVDGLLSYTGSTAEHFAKPEVEQNHTWLCVCHSYCKNLRENAIFDSRFVVTTQINWCVNMEDSPEARLPSPLPDTSSLLFGSAIG